MKYLLYYNLFCSTILMWCLHLHSWHLPFILTGCLFLGNEFYIVILWILTSINVEMIFMVVIKQKQLFWVVTGAALLTYNNTNLQCACQENCWRDSSEKQSLISNLSRTGEKIESWTIHLGNHGQTTAVKVQQREIAVERESKLRNEKMRKSGEDGRPSLLIVF